MPAELKVGDHSYVMSGERLESWSPVLASMASLNGAVEIDARECEGSGGMHDVLRAVAGKTPTKASKHVQRIVRRCFVDDDLATFSTLGRFAEKYDVAELRRDMTTQLVRWVKEGRAKERFFVEYVGNPEHWPWGAPLLADAVQRIQMDPDHAALKIVASRLPGSAAISVVLRAFKDPASCALKAAVLVNWRVLRARDPETFDKMLLTVDEDFRTVRQNEEELDEDEVDEEMDGMREDRIACNAYSLIRLPQAGVGEDGDSEIRIKTPLKKGWFKWFDNFDIDYDDIDYSTSRVDSSSYGVDALPQMCKDLLAVANSRALPTRVVAVWDDRGEVMFMEPGLTEAALCKLRVKSDDETTTTDDDEE